MKMKSSIVSAMMFAAVILCGTMLMAFDGEQIGKIGEVNTVTGEVVVQSPQAAAKIKMGSKLYVRINGKVVIMTATYPMQTVAKCKLIPSNAGYLGQIGKGIPVYGYIAGMENVDNAATAKGGNLLFPLDGVTLGKTTVNQLARLGTRATDKDSSTGDFKTYYKINNNDVWYDKTTKIAEKFEITYHGYMPEKWKALGLDFKKSYNDWISLGQKYGWVVNITKQPQIIQYSGHPSFSADVEMSYRSDGIVYEIKLDFDYSEGASETAENTLYSIEVKAVGKYTPSDIESALQGKSLLFPLDGVTLGKTTVNQLVRLGTRATDKDSSTGDYFKYYKVNGNNVWYDNKTNLANRYALFSISDKSMPEKWKIIGFDFKKSYDEWISLTQKYGWDINIIKQPEVIMDNGQPSFNAEIEFSYEADGLTNVVKLTFANGKGTTRSDRNTIWKIDVGISKIDQLTIAANKGDAESQSILGYSYLNGEGVNKNEELAVKWLTKAANQGLAIGQYNLGVCYQNGTGVKQDYNLAAFWYKKAALQGYSDAQYNLGTLYINGNGVEQDYKSAVFWYEKCAARGNARAQCNLGWCYENGKGVIKNMDMAVSLYKKAAEQGNETAKNNLRNFGIE